MKPQIPSQHRAEPIARRAALPAALFLFAGAGSASAETADSEFRLRVGTVDSLFQRARKARSAQQVTLPAYAAIISLLREEELAIASEARAHRFQDEAESNFWFRSRLKFPTVLETEERLLGEGFDPAFLRP